jgi:hypothetical protein
VVTVALPKRNLNSACRSRSIPITPLFERSLDLALRDVEIAFLAENGAGLAFASQLENGRSPEPG